MSDIDDAIRQMNELRAVGEQLTGYDAATWRTALGSRTMRSPVMALLLLDGVPDWERLRSRYERLTRVIPSLRNRPISGMLGVSMPRMALDPDFDLDIHLHRMRLPEGTGWSGVLAEARRMSLTDFDLDRPLWEANLIEGLEGGRSALLIKLHHAIADGQATVMIGANLFELTADGTPNEPPAPEAPAAVQASHRDVSRANITDNVRRGLDFAAAGARIIAGLAAGTLKDPLATWGEAADMLTSVGRFAAVPEAPLSPLMDKRSTTYRFLVFEVPFPLVRAAAKQRESTVNDVFMAAVATGMAHYHERYGKPTPQLRFNIPISLRNASKDGSAANAVTIARFQMPVNNATVEDRIKVAHEQVRRWREEPALTLANPLADASWLIPVPVIASAARASDVTTSNVPGPPVPLYIAGVRCVGTWPLVATIGAAVNITMVTYDGTGFVGVSADDKAVPDPEILVEDLRRGFADLIGAKVGPTDPVARGRRGEGQSHAATVRGQGSRSAKGAGSARKAAAAISKPVPIDAASAQEAEAAPEE